MLTLRCYLLSKRASKGSVGLWFVGVVVGCGCLSDGRVVKGFEMKVADGIKYLAGDIVRRYVEYVRDRVRERSAMFIIAGIDEDIQTYQLLFREALARAAGKSCSDALFDDALVSECADVILWAAWHSKYSRFLKRYADGVYGTCLKIYKQVEAGVLDEWR